MKASHPCSPSPSSLRVLTHRRFIASWSRWLIAGVLAWAMTTTVTRVQALIPGGPEIAVFQGTATGTELFDNTSSVSLGTVNTDSSASQTITIKNTASGDSLTGLSLSKAGDADFTLSALGVTSLAPGATASFTITFIPSAAGTRTATIRIASNDANENPFEIAVTGTGVLVSNPGGTDKTVPLVTSSTYTFSLADWGFTDVGDTPPNAFTAVKITSLPTSGKLYVDNVEVATPGTIISTQPGQAGATWTQRIPTEYSAGWTCVASSADGAKLVAGDDNLWLSTDSGATWTKQTGADTPTGYALSSITSSDNGSRLAAASFAGIWLSTDSGASWTKQTGSGAGQPPSAPWSSIASSSDGSKLVAAASSGHIWTYNDSSTPAWTEQFSPPLGTSTQPWHSVACSNDGQVILAALYGRNLWRSTNAGTTWTEIVSGGGITAPTANQYWASVTASADGSKLAAVVEGGDIWTSADSGTNWVQRSGGTTGISTIKSWRSITSSDDGSRLAAVVDLGHIWTSIDSGATWTERTGVGTSRNFRSIASSADGSKLAVVAESISHGSPMTPAGGIWTSAGTAPVITYQSTTTPGTGSFTFQVQDSGSSNNEDTSANTFTFNVTLPPPPTVTGISPATGSTAGGTSVTLTGTGFTGATGVTIGGVAATAVTVVSDTSLTCTTPAGTAGTASVVVTTPSGSNAANTLYTYVVPEINVYQGDALTGTALTDNADTVDLGTVNTGSSASQTITIKNTGTGSLTGLALSKAGTNAADYTLSSLGVTSLAPDATASFTITFSPLGAGTRIATVSILSNDGDENPFRIPVTGTGVAVSNPGGTDKTVPLVTSSTYTFSLADWGFTDVGDTPPNAFTAVKITSLPTTGKLYVDSVEVTNLNQIVSTQPGPVGATWTQRNPTGHTEWQCIASSADGTKLAAAKSLGNIWLSTDSGATWTEQTGNNKPTAGPTWTGITSSDDGSRLAVTTSSGIWLSTNSGATWTEQTGSGSGQPPRASWMSIASSSDGSKMVAALGDGHIWTYNSSSTPAWTEQLNSPLADSTYSWRSVACSNDGQVILAARSRGNLSRSLDAGATWTEIVSANSALGITTPPTANQSWWSVTASADGSKLAAVVFGGDIWTSADSGASWARCSGGSTGISSTKLWTSITSSDDGSRLAACVQSGGNIWTSADSGATWTERTGAGANRNFGSIASSSNGSKLAVASTNQRDFFQTFPGGIWTSPSPPPVITYQSTASAVTDSFTFQVQDSGTSGINEDTSANTFTFNVTTPVVPTVTSISPTSGSLAGGTSVTLTGSGFLGTTGVTIRGVAATAVTVVSDTSITCTTPAGTAGTASVVVTTPGGSNAANTLYTYSAVSSDATLSNLIATTATLSPATFAPATTAYTSSVPNSTTSVTVTPTVAESNATVQVRIGSGAFVSVTSGSASSALALSVGINTIEVQVTAQDGTTTKTYTLTITRAASPEITVKGNSVEIVSGDTTPGTTDGTDFGSLLVNGGTQVRTFTITNTGTVDLTLSSNPKVAVSSTDFTVTTQPTSPVVANTGSTTFVITFDPSAEGARTATVTIVNDDSDEGTYTFAIKGTGLVVAPVPFTIGGLPKHIVTNEGATDATGAADGTQFDILGRGGYLAANGTLGVPGTLKIGVGGVTEVPNNFQAYWKDDGTGLKRLVRSGDAAPGTNGALFNAIPTIPVPGLNPQGVVTLLSALRIGTGGVTASDDSAMWSEVGGNGLQLLMRENDPVPGISGGLVSSFGFGCYATANTGDKTGEAVFAIKMKGATLDSALLRQSITGPGTASVSIVAREKTAAPGAGGELFGPLHSTLGAATRMDTTGNIVFEGQIRPSGKYGIWYQPVAGSLSKVFIAGEAAPGTSSATFSTFEMPSMGSSGTFAFVGYLNADGDNAANDKNNGVWRGTAAGGLSPILRRGDAALPGMVAGSKVGHLWSGWLNQNNRGAWRGWIDTAGDGVSAFPDDTYGIYTDAGGTMRLLLKVNDIAPGTGGATLASVDHPVVSGATAGNEHVAFLGTLSGAGVTAGNAKAIWRSDNGSTPVLLLRTGDSMTTSKGDKIVANIDMPGTNMDIRPWELPVMDNDGRVLMVITFTDGTTSQVIAPGSTASAPAPCPTITVNSLPSAGTGDPYNQTAVATGGTAPYTWSATNLPTGLSITPAGVISGTPTTNGTATITATDANGCTGTTTLTSAPPST